MSTFVTVGNPTQPFRRLLDAVAEVAADLPAPITVQHGSTPFAAPNCIARQYVGREEFAELVQAAQIFISHAGAGCILEAIRAGKVPIVMARLRKYREHVDDHQLQLAETLAAEGKAILISDTTALRGAIAPALALQEKRARTDTEPLLVDMVRQALRSIDERDRNRRG